jgi:Cu(I)/Ag(I) efflux system membrane protein CusA/SilA
LLPIVTPAGGSIVLADVAKVYVADGPPSIKSENARLNGWTYVAIQGVDLSSYVDRARKLVSEQIDLPPGYTLTWAGQYEYMERAKQRLQVVVPLTLAVILLLLYLNFRQPMEVLIIITSLPLALVGGLWFMWWQSYEFSVAVAVGFIALAGVATEIGVLMLTYLGQAWRAQERIAAEQSRPRSMTDLHQAIAEGAGMRVRPIMMTVLATIAGLVPAMMGDGAGSEVLRRIAGPMIGGLVTAVLLSLILLPVVFLLWKRREIQSDQAAKRISSA